MFAEISWPFEVDSR